FVTVAPPDGTANLTLVAPEPGSEQHKLIGRPIPVTFVTEDVIAKYREWTKRGVRFQFAPRLKRLKYEVHVRAPHSADPTASSAEHAPIWGGVFTRFMDLGQGRLVFVIGDISGKGIAAALLMANLQANLRSQCAIALDQPQRLLCSVNQLFCDNTPDGAFATLFFAEYDDTASRLRYAN